MTINVRANLITLACIVGGCADDKDPQVTGPTSATATTSTATTSTATTEGPSESSTGVDPTGGMTSESSTGDDPTGGLPSMEVCERYLDCLAQVAPGGLPEAQQGYGPDGTCWKGSLQTAEQCLEACQVGLDQWHETVPDEPKCGTVTVSGIDGQYLLAVATTIAPDLPFQFLATFETDAAAVLTLTLQPLTLDQGNVTTPRQPFGAPLQFADITVDNGQFDVDLGMVAIGGPTNPITGADIIAQLGLTATVVDMDFVCGTVAGQVVDPPVGNIDGSTFAAVRLDGPNTLPSNVIVNCNGLAVTGP